MSEAKQSKWRPWITSGATGVFGFFVPRVLLGLGVPIDQWAVAMGAWVSLHYSRESALNSLGMVTALLLMAWGNEWPNRAKRALAHLNDSARKFFRELEFRSPVARRDGPSMTLTAPNTHKPSERIFTRRTAEELLGYFKTHNAFQANKLMEVDKGLWIDASGTIVLLGPTSASGGSMVVIRTSPDSLIEFRFGPAFDGAIAGYNVGDTLRGQGRILQLQSGGTLHLEECELVTQPVAPGRELSLSPDQRDRKLRALDKLRTQVRQMQPYINKAERLSSAAWNAFATGQGLALGDELLAFRDAFQNDAQALNALRDQYPEYEDAISVTRMPDLDEWLRSMGDHVMTFQILYTYLKDGTPGDAFARLLKNDADRLSTFVMSYTHWHNKARVSLDALCRDAAT